MAGPTQQEIEDIRNAPKIERAYNRASSTPPNPKPATKKEAASRDVVPSREEAMLQEVADAKRRAKETAAYNRAMPMADTSTNYAKGGSVSASRRADGVAQRGKTRGKLV